jgi:hypothetical protein
MAESKRSECNRFRTERQRAQWQLPRAFGRRNYRYSYLDIDTGLAIHELWNDPPTSPIYQLGQSVTALPTLACDSGGAFSIGDINGADLNRGFAFTYEQLVIPPKGRVMFEVYCDTGYQIFDGEAQADFRENGRQVLCPGVWIAVLP